MDVRVEYKESWVPKNWWFCTLLLEKTLDSPLDSKEIQPVNPKGNHSWLFLGIIDTEAETPIFWPPDAKNQVNGKNPDAGKNWGQEEKGTTEDERVESTDSMDMGLGRLRELVIDREAWHAVIHGVAKSWTRLSDGTELSNRQILLKFCVNFKINFLFKVQNYSYLIKESTLKEIQVLIPQ